jgi:hypothetical protein
LTPCDACDVGTPGTPLGSGTTALEGTAPAGAADAGTWIQVLVGSGLSLWRLL